MPFTAPATLRDEDAQDYRVLNRSDGGISIMRLPTGSTPEYIAARVVEWEGTGGGVKILDHAPIDPAKFPSRRFRPAWIKGGSVPIEVDIAKARGIVLADVRSERDRRLAASDSDKARLDELGTPQQQKALKDYRQALRDLPNAEAAKVNALALADLEAYAPPWPTPPA